MYSPVVQRSPTEEEDRMRRDTRASSTSHQLPPYSSRSPTMSHYHGYSPQNGSMQHQRYDSAYASRPSSSAAMHIPTNVNQSPRLSTPASPTNGLSQPSRSGYSQREPVKTTYYDPTTDHRENSSSWNPHSYNSHSPVHHRESAAYYERQSDEISDHTNHRSPTNTHFPRQQPFPNLHSHPPHRHETSTLPSGLVNTPPSPHLTQNHSSISHIVNGTSEPLSETDYRVAEPKSRAVEEIKSTRHDPMSFSNILSTHNIETPKAPVKSWTPVQKSEIVETPAKNEVPDQDHGNEKVTPVAPPGRKLAKKSPAVKEEPVAKPIPKEISRPKATKGSASKKSAAALEKEMAKVKQALADIDKQELSDLDINKPEWELARTQHKQKSHKRLVEVEDAENEKRKFRRNYALGKHSRRLTKNVEAGRELFKIQNEAKVIDEVHQQEVFDEKERKKDMQRKRRREKTILNETQKQKEAIEKASQAADGLEREKFLKEAKKAEKKAKTTKRALEIGDIPEEIGEVTPMPHNLEGGTMSSFPTANGTSPEPPSKKQKKAPAPRPKKTKQQKQQEKDNAEIGHILQMDQRVDLELPTLLPKEKDKTPMDTPVVEKKSKTKKDVPAKDASPAPQVNSFASKGFQQLYEQIWRDIARKEIPKVFRVKAASEEIKAQNLKKTATLASKEAKRFQMKTNKGQKEGAARSKRSIRETGTFWKRNEKVEKERAKLALREETERLKRLEVEKEAARQKRKLEFLISQTELFSYFVNKKKGSEGDGVDGDKTDGAADEAQVNFEELDFDDEDGSARHKIAKANAEAAYKKAQDNRGELDFQNPSSLDDEEVPQPKMLACQLKEYQLKGLNWLRGLFVKGINGILADEMGLGKTVQSISILSWLAEVQNIWGPFLVVAPASTLHNWEQEITRFVPDLKILPYWGNQKDRKVLRKCWDRKHKTYAKDTPFHVMVTSYEIVVRDPGFFQKQDWRYMILDEAQAIKSSSSARWQTLLKVRSDGRVLLTGTPIQNNMHELWALLHFIMPDLFDSHDEFSEWFSKDIESHTQSNTKLDEEQLKRLHMVLKPFMLRRVKKDVQKELGEKIENDVVCTLSYRQRAIYKMIRNKVRLWDILTVHGLDNSGEGADTLMNLVVQLRKLCNHPNLFERAETTSPYAFASHAEISSFIREGRDVNLAYSTKNTMDYELPRLLCSPEGRFDMAGPTNARAGAEMHYLYNMMNIWHAQDVNKSCEEKSAFSWLRFANTSAQEASRAAHENLFMRSVRLHAEQSHLGRLKAMYDDGESSEHSPVHSMFNIVSRDDRRPLAEICKEGRMLHLLNVSKTQYMESGLGVIELCASPAALAPPIQIYCSNQGTAIERQNLIFNVPMRKALYDLSLKDEQALLDANIKPQSFPQHSMLPAPTSLKARYTHIKVPSMRRFVTDSGKLAKLDALLRELKPEGHRVLLYFQMTRMMDLMEEYLTYRNFKYVRLDGSTSIESRRDRVEEFQTNPDIFVFLLSTRAGGLGINLTAADTVIFYDSDWNPTMDSQAMDRAHRLGQTRQVTVYRLITMGTVEERIRKRALQKQEVQQLVITGEASGGIDFNSRDKDTRAKDYAMFLAEDDDEAELIERREQELAEQAATEKKKGRKKAVPAKRKEMSLDDMYHEGEGHFDDNSNKPSNVATPMDSDTGAGPPKKGPRGGRGSKKAKTTKERLAIIDGSGAP